MEMPRRISNLDLLIRVGEAVYGPYWQKSIAEDLGVNRRTINRWLRNVSPVADAMSDGTPLVDALMKAVERQEKRLIAVKAMLTPFTEQ